MKKLFYLFLAFGLTLNSCKKEKMTVPYNNAYSTDNSFKIVAYMPSYRDPALIDNSKYKMITHLFYAFLSPSVIADGSLMALPQQARFSTMQKKAKDNNVKFGISIGIANGVTQETFSTIAKSPIARAFFVKNIVDFARNNNLDGVDMDWEYPRTQITNGLIGPNKDFTALMKELSNELHKLNKFLSAAITPGVYASTNKDAIEQEVYQYVDFFNIMQYDGAGYDTTEPLNHASLKMTNASLDYWLNNKGLPYKKAILGMPLYGKNAAGNSKSFRDIEASRANINLNIATIDGVDYGYNGIQLIKEKTQIAKDRSMGVMFWEFAHDSNTSNSLIRAANDQLGRKY